MSTTRTSRRAALLLAVGATLAAADASAADRPAAKSKPGTVLVTGANRGIGLDLARTYVARKYHVIATARRPEDAADLQALAKSNPGMVSIEKLDVTDDAAVDALAAKYKGKPIDILINNAGIDSDRTKQKFGSIDYGDFDAVMRTNAKAPLKIAEAFMDSIAASNEKRLVVISSSAGSLGSQANYSSPFYRASKSAVNMLMKNVSFAVKDRGVTVMMINPGAVDTDMGKAVQKSAPGQAAVWRDPAVVAKELADVIAKSSLAKTGAFYNYDGAEMPW